MGTISISTIEPGKYKIKISRDPRIYYADCFDRAEQALRHYFIRSHNKNICPLCNTITVGEKA